MHESALASSDRGGVRSCALLVAIIFFLTAMPALAAAEDNDRYPMFHYDLQRTGNVSGDGPLTNGLLWSTYLGGFVGSSPIVADGHVYVSNWEMGSGSYGLHCLDERTGSILWTNSLTGGDGGASTAALCGDRIVVGSKKGYLYCINATGGGTLWSKQIEHNPLFWGVASSPIVDETEEVIFITTFSNNSLNNGTLHVVDFTGSELWSISTGDTFYYTSPAIIDGTVFFAGNLTNHSLFCANISSHTIVWRFNTSTQIKSTPAIWNNTVFFAAEDRMYAVNARTGVEVWNNPFSCVMSSPAVSSGKVYIGSDDKNLYCYDAISGVELWNCTVDGVIQSSPVVARDTVYFGTSVFGAVGDGTVYALNATHGSLRWSYNVDLCVMSSPAVADGLLFVGSDDGHVYAFGENPAITTTIRIEGKDETIWHGDVTFSNSTIMDTDNVSHYLDKPTALGALDAASKRGNFSYEVENQTEVFFVKSIRGEADTTVPGDRWLYRVDYHAPTVNAADFVMGVTEPPSTPHSEILWYCGSRATAPLDIALDKASLAVGELFHATVHYYNDSSSDWEPLDNATVYVGTEQYRTGRDGNATISVARAGSYTVYAEKEGFVRSIKRTVSVSLPCITVRIEGENETIWCGDVTVSNTTIVDTANVSHYLDRPTALGALAAASKLGNFSYTVEDMGWGLLVTSIGGKVYNPVTWDPSWLYRVDYYSPLVGAADFVLNVTKPPSPPHEEVLWYLGSFTAAPLKITLDRASVKVNEHFTATVGSYNDTAGLWDLVDTATVHVDGANYTTDLNGSAVIALSKAGTYALSADKKGCVRSEKKSITVTPGEDGGDGGDDGDGIFWWVDVSVSLPEGTFTKAAINTNKIFTIKWQTALGALQKASEVRGFEYTLEEWDFGPFVYSIGITEKYDEGETSGWMYQVNGNIPDIGAHEYSVDVGDEIIWYFSEDMDTTPFTALKALRLTIEQSSEDTGDEESTSSPTPAQTVPHVLEGLRKIACIEAGSNASVTFDRTNVTRIIIYANNTICNASIMIQPLEEATFAINASRVPYCYFNVTTTNLTGTDIANATIEFKVNRTWINASNIDEATISLYRYYNNHGNAVPTVKLGEDNTSLYFKAVTPGFSVFVISGERKTLPAVVSSPAPSGPLSAPEATTEKSSPATIAPLPASASTLRTMIPRLHEIAISMVSIAVLVIVLVAYYARRRERE